MKKYFFILFLVFATSVVTVHADSPTPSTTGFISGQIWYSENPLVEGDTVRIYTAVWNGNKSPASTHVEFYDANVLLGARDVIIPSLHIQDVSITWIVTSGDHAISAKISSSTITTNGKKVQVAIGNSTTTSDRTYVPIGVKTIDGVTASSVNVVKNEITKASANVKEIVPDSVEVPISNGYNSLDTLRIVTYKDIIDTKNETQKKIDDMNGITQASEESPTTKDNNKTIPPKIDQKESKPVDVTDKPIAYVKLFFFSVLEVIFGSKLVFYGLIVVIIFLISRFIYRKIRNRK